MTSFKHQLNSFKPIKHQYFTFPFILHKHLAQHGGEAASQTRLSSLNADFIASFTEWAGGIILLSLPK